MGVFYEQIPESLIAWTIKQQVFWVSTAPLSATGHVNVSPKGGEYFGVPDNKTFWYMDLTGSGNETISHLREPGNGRITILFNAFEGPPRIVRFWGKGRVLENGTPDFDDIVDRHSIKCIPGTRSIIVVDIHQVGSSCGFSVPFFDFKEHRPVLNDFFKKKEVKFLAGDEKESMDRYWAYKNAWSMDGLPGMQRALEAGEREKVEPIKKMIGPFAPRDPHGSSTSSHVAVERAIIAVLIVLLFLIILTHPSLESGLVRTAAQRLMPQAKKLIGGTISSIEQRLKWHPGYRV